MSHNDSVCTVMMLYDALIKWCLQTVILVSPDDTLQSQDTWAGVGAAYLVRLGNICKDSIYHGYEHPVLLWMSCILNDRNDVGSVLGHVYQISACNALNRVGKYDAVM